MKRIHQQGGRSVYTWEKHPQDKIANLIAAVLVSIGLVQLGMGHYRLATG
jgi:hypothetical protein